MNSLNTFSVEFRGLTEGDLFLDLFGGKRVGTELDVEHLFQVITRNLQHLQRMLEELLQPCRHLSFDVVQTEQHRCDCDQLTLQHACSLQSLCFVDFPLN